MKFLARRSSFSKSGAFVYKFLRLVLLKVSWDPNWSLWQPYLYILMFLLNLSLINKIDWRKFVSYFIYNRCNIFCTKNNKKVLGNSQINDLIYSTWTISFVVEARYAMKLLDKLMRIPSNMRMGRNLRKTLDIIILLRYGTIWARGPILGTLSQ